jgi:hypothetical protein
MSLVLGSLPITKVRYTFFLLSPFLRVGLPCPSKENAAH